MVRYADDFIVTAQDKGSLENAQIQIQQWLSERGLNLSTEKTLITSMEDGFDFRRLQPSPLQWQIAH